MKTFENPIEVCVQLSEVGDGVLRAVLECNLRLSPLDSASFRVSVLCGVFGDGLSFHSLYDGSFIAVGCPDLRPFPNSESLPSLDRVIHLPVREYELQDGKLHNVSFTLNQSIDARRDYVLQGVRFIRLLGTVSVEVECDEEES